MLQITYQKKDGCIIQRLRNTMLPYKIGEITSMGWKVLNIEYEYNNKFYPVYEYHKLINQKKQKYIKKQQMIEICKSEIRILLYYFITLVVVNLLKCILGK